LHDVSGVLITHEHADHINGLTGFKDSGIPVFAHAAAAAAIERKISGLTLRRIYGAAFGFADVCVAPFFVPHDAAGSLGFRLTAGGVTVAVATDIGRVSEDVIRGLSDADCLVVEANHDENMLLRGRYPERLKRRITGGGGHISNSAAAELLRLTVSPRTKNVFLAHLSEENNLPELAFDTVAKSLKKYGIEEGADIKISVLKQSARGEILSF
jgi:phosphoribosyl 1,2-cyclic phosphodiesterase